MNNLIISLLTLPVFFFHLYIRRPMRWGKVKEGLAALWCMDAVFTVCGILISFALYHYSFAPFLTLRNLLLVAAYLLLTFLFLLLSPSGISLLFPKKQTDHEAILAAEDTQQTFSFHAEMYILFCIHIQEAANKQKLFPF